MAIDQAALENIKQSALAIQQKLNTMASEQGSQNNSGATQVTPPTTTTTQGAANDPFIKQLMEQMQGSQGAVSSSNTKIDDLLSQAAQQLKSGAQSNSDAVSSQYNRLEDYQKQQNSQDMTHAQDAQHGFGVNTALIDHLTETGDRAIKDLEQRKQELILQGNSTAAAKIADLQVQQAQFTQQSTQQAFTNMLGMANFGLSAYNSSVQQQQQQQQIDLQNKTFSYNQQKDISTLAAQYGVSVSPGDSLNDVMAKIAPYASQEEKLKLNKMQLDNAEIQANISKLRADAKTFNPNDPKQMNAAMYMLKVYGVNSMDSLIKSNPANAGLVAQKLGEEQTPGIKQYAAEKFASGESISQIVDELASGKAIGTVAVDTATILKLVTDTSNSTPRNPGLLDKIATKSAQLFYDPFRTGQTSAQGINDFLK